MLCLHYRVDTLSQEILVAKYTALPTFVLGGLGEAMKKLGNVGNA
jgi:hypothetical protein